MKGSSIDFTFHEEAQTVSCRIDYDSDNISLEDFVDFCRRAALLIGYCDESVNEIFNAYLE